MLSVYVIHYDAPDRCRSTVRSLMSQVGVSVDVTVVPNGGARPELPDSVRVLEPGANLGYTGAANFALADRRQRSDRSDIFGIACHEVELPPGGVQSLENMLTADSGLGIVAPAVVQSEMVAGHTIDGQSSRPDTGNVDCRWVSGAFMLVRATCVADVGEFDEDLGSYCEDLDYCIRARAQGGWSP